ncbi:hypothetical protein VMCG_02121 [Cytospora schulzeri]|uniref:CENP-T/Histone H4 histone fold domain-containing protein n=1 Tax=Cytospora schulzeri TaxID=448051 RepID=A0A423X3N4_9PEZI|nr:hypothetical protein VMCG_02121 [Valsa malicola]
MSTPSRRSPSKATATTTTTPRRSSSHPVHDRPSPEKQTPAYNPRASAPPPSNPGTRFSIRTPSQVNDFRASRQQPLLSASGRKPTQFTPHGRAAIRALDLRRAAINDINTPGRNRRRSMRDQRETPRDFLRALSRTLAPKSRAITTSSSSSPEDPKSSTNPKRRSKSKGSRRGGPITIPEDPDDSDEFPIDRPRLSLPIDEDDASDDDLRPPRMSGLEDLEDNFTMQSIEMARRQTFNEQQRYSMRMSDYGPMGDQQSDIDEVGIDSAFFPRTDLEGNVGDDTGLSGMDDNDATFERVDDDEAARRETLGRESFGAIDVNFDEAEQSTVMPAPQMQSSPARQEYSSSPRNEPFENEPFDVGMEDEPLDDEPLDDEPLGNEPLPPPEDMDVENNSALLDIGGGGGGDDDDIEISDLEEGAAEVAKAKQTSSRSASKRLTKPGKKMSKYGIEYPSLPPGVVKRVAQRFAGKSKISPDTLSALMQASDWFFEQLGDDLSAYAKHAGRKTIEESDMLTLMRRQRQVNATTTPFALAQRHLPRELLQELRMPPPAPTKTKTKKRRRAPANPEEEDEDVT